MKLRAILLSSILAVGVVLPAFAQENQQKSQTSSSQTSSDQNQTRPADQTQAQPVDQTQTTSADQDQPASDKDKKDNKKNDKKNKQKMPSPSIPAGKMTWMPSETARSRAGTVLH